VSGVHRESKLEQSTMLFRAFHDAQAGSELRRTSGVV
jgi:hypothetical protein